jgi:hypothetical protein
MFQKISLWFKRSWFGRNWDKVLWPILSVLWLEPARDLSHYFHTYIQENAPRVVELIVGWPFIPFEVNLLIIIVFVVGYSFTYHLVTKLMARRRPSPPVFIEDFAAPASVWEAPYWGGPPNSVRVMNGHLVLQADVRVWNWSEQPNENGALVKLRSGIVQGERYKITATVRSGTNGTTMGFLLWVHDGSVRGLNAVRDPDLGFRMPSPNFYQTFQVEFVATESNAMTIHLHAQAGSGSIQVRDVRVIKM